jgi:hypothetical protein
MVFELRKPNEKWFFLLVLPIAIAIEWAFASWHDWGAYPRSEWVALVDLCLFMPLVYFTLFATELSIKARLLRCIAIAGIGLFAASFIVPEANQFVVGKLSDVRNALLVFVLAFEGWVFWKLINAVYRKDADVNQLHNDFAMPQWMAKLLILEARFWKAVIGFFRRK